MYQTLTMEQVATSLFLLILHMLHAHCNFNYFCQRNEDYSYTLLLIPMDQKNPPKYQFQVCSIENMGHRLH